MKNNAIVRKKCSCLNECQANFRTSELQSPNVSINVRRDILCIIITFHIIHRTEHLGIKKQYDG